MFHLFNQELVDAESQLLSFLILIVCMCASKRPQLLTLLDTFVTSLSQLNDVVES